MDDTTKTYLVAEKYLPELRQKLDKLSRRADKLGVGAITYELGNVQDRPYLIVDGRPFKHLEGKELEDARAEGETIAMIRFQEITVTGTTPRLQGWTFVATLQHLQDDKGQTINLLRTVPGFEGQLPERFRTATSENCDHCHKNIKTRKDTFVVQHESGEWKQVGRNCTQDFLGGVDPQKVVSYLDLVLRFHETANDDGFGSAGWGGGEYRFPMAEFLSVVALMVRTEGWVSRGKARASLDQGVGALEATADLTWRYLVPPRDSRAFADWQEWRNSNSVTDADREVAEKAMDYARYELVNKATRSDYEHNLYVATLQATVNGRLSGITASLVPYYLKEVEKQVIREAELRQVKNSQHFGAAGERLVMQVQVAKIIPHTNDWGTTYIHKLFTVDGNLVIWFNRNNSGNLVTGQEYAVKATVTKHDIRDGVKQTMVNRLVVLTAEEVEKEKKKAARKAKKS